jgi:hypothetical protein
VHIEECFAFSTKNRAPILLCLEVIDYADPVPTAAERQRCWIRSLSCQPCIFLDFIRACDLINSIKSINFVLLTLFSRHKKREWWRALNFDTENISLSPSLSSGLPPPSSTNLFLRATEGIKGRGEATGEQQLLGSEDRHSLTTNSHKGAEVRPCIA